jgi:hypothetical protein
MIVRIIIFGVQSNQKCIIWANFIQQKI